MTLRSIRYIATYPTLVLTLLALAAACLVPAGAHAAATPNGGWDAAWSPDGQRLAFTSGSPHSIPNLWTVNPDRSGLRQMTTRGAHEPQWLPDGKTIVFGTIRRGASSFMTIAADGEPGSEKNLDVLPPGAEMPVWTKDGSLIAYAVMSKSGASRDLEFVRAGGGSKTGLTSNFWCREWVWSPDGERLAFVVGRSAGTSIWTTDLATQDVRILYKGFSRALAYSPDGKRLAFAVPDVRSAFHIVVMDLETFKETPIAVTSFNGQKIIWSPDGRRLYFCSSRKAEAAVWSVGSDGKNLSRVTPQGTPSTAPALSPNGQRIACQITKKSSYSPEIAVFSTAGRMLTQVTSGSKPSFWAPIWSPDGKEFAFQSDVRHTAGLYTGSISGRLGSERAEINGPIRAEVAWMQDSKRLLLTDAGRLLIVNKAGGKNAVTPVPKLSAMVQGAQVRGDEVIFTEWGLRDAVLSAYKLDGSARRAITQRAVETAKTEAKQGAKPNAKPEAKPDARPNTQPQVVPHATTEAKPKPALIGPANAKLSRNTGVVISLASNSRGFEVTSASNRRDAVLTLVADAPKDAATGNPHASLGIIGPHENMAKNDTPPVLDLWPAVSPDRKMVAFLRDDQIWIVNADGTGERKITALPKSDTAARTLGAPVWSPEGSTLVFPGFTTTAGKMTLELWTCRVAAGSERLVYSEDVDTEYGPYYSECTHGPAFMAGGKRILFTSLASGDPAIASVGVDGSDLRQIVPAPSAFPSLDASGRKLVYVDLSDFQERIRVMDMATGKRGGPLFR